MGITEVHGSPLNMQLSLRGSVVMVGLLCFFSLYIYSLDVANTIFHVRSLYGK